MSGINVLCDVMVLTVQSGVGCLISVINIHFISVLFFSCQVLNTTGLLHTAETVLFLIIISRI